jgi:tyrosyl-tRNA synthetase
MKIGCFKNEKVAAKIINAGGFYINQVRRQNAEEVIMPGTHILPNQMTLVRVGKRNYYVVDWTM